MCDPIMVACDLHDEQMLLKVARGRAPAKQRSVKNDRSGREKLLDWLRKESAAAGGAAVVFAYEASGQGFGLHDELTAAGFACHVLAPTKIARSSSHARRKTDARERILELLRGHVLAGNPLPNVWIPDLQTRDDRLIVRQRLDLSNKQRAVKAQIRCLLKQSPERCELPKSKSWSKSQRRWLQDMCRSAAYPQGFRETLASLLRQLTFLDEELQRVEECLARLAETPRYAAAVQALDELNGVGPLTALVFLTEMGDPGRFANRRQVAAYLGLVPASQESGARNDRKGHITRQGPSRVRQVLCQAVWARVRHTGADHAVYQQLAAKNPKHKKIAVVAIMRRLAIRMWHRAREAQQLPPPFWAAGCPSG